MTGRYDAIVVVVRAAFVYERTGWRFGINAAYDPGSDIPASAFGRSFPARRDRVTRLRSIRV